MADEDWARYIKRHTGIARALFAKHGYSGVLPRVVGCVRLIAKSCAKACQGVPETRARFRFLADCVSWRDSEFWEQQIAST